MRGSRTPQPRRTNNSRSAADTTPLSEVLRRARTRRVPASATTNRGFANRAAAATSPVTNGRSFTTEDEPNGGDVISALKLQTEEIALSQNSLACTQNPLFVTSHGGLDMILRDPTCPYAAVVVTVVVCVDVY